MSGTKAIAASVVLLIAISPIWVVQANIALFFDADDLVSRPEGERQNGGVLLTWSITAFLVGVLQIPYAIICWRYGRKWDVNTQTVRIVFMTGETILIALVICALAVPTGDEFPNTGTENRARYSLILFIIAYTLITLYIFVQYCSGTTTANASKPFRGKEPTLSFTELELQNFILNLERRLESEKFEVNGKDASDAPPPITTIVHLNSIEAEISKPPTIDSTGCSVSVLTPSNEASYVEELYDN